MSHKEARNDIIMALLTAALVQFVFWHSGWDVSVIRSDNWFPDIITAIMIVAVISARRGL